MPLTVQTPVALTLAPVNPTDGDALYPSESLFPSENLFPSAGDFDVSAASPTALTLTPGPS